MIRYRLICDSEHEFDSWFDNSAAYDRLSAAGLLECPHCGSAQVRKTMMSPRVRTGRSQAEPREPDAGAGAGAETASSELVAAPDPQLQQLHTEALELARKVRDYVKENSEYVGPRFVEEARKIHFEEEAPRGIYGEASSEDVRELREDGIGVMPMPELPEDKN